MQRSAIYLFQQMRDEASQLFVGLRFHADEFDSDSIGLDAPHDRIGLEGLQSGVNFQIHLITFFKMVFGFEECPSQGEISNAGRTSSRPRNRRG